MSAGTHTPGPWRINEFGEVIGGDGRKLLASGVSLTSGNHDDADVAAENARLIAAAPDLLDALYNAHNYLCMIRGIIAPLPKRDGACAMIECHDSAALIIEHAIAMAEGRA